MGTERAQAEQAVAKPITKSRGSAGLLMVKPKFLFFLAAGLSFFMSVSLFFTGSREQGIYVGIWVPSILSAGALLLGNSRHE